MGNIPPIEVSDPSWPKYVNQQQAFTRLEIRHIFHDTLSVLQVVDNPGWLLPYVSCVLVSIGLLVHFALSLRRATRRAAPPRVVPQQEAA